MNKKTNFWKIFKFLAVFPAIFSTSCFKKDTKTDVESYVEILTESRNESDFHTELYICPETIENLEVKSFYYAHIDDLFTGSFLMYLVIEYDETNFSSEIQRLSGVKANFKDRGTKSIISFPEQNLYLTIKLNKRFEYAIYDTEKYQIAYISNQIFEWKDTPIEEKFIIPELQIPSELQDKENMFNLYYWYEGDVGFYIED